MDKTKVRQILTSIIIDIRKKDEEKVKKQLIELAKDPEIKIELDLFRTVNTLGRLFSYFKAYPYIVFINGLLKDKKSTLLRLIRQEMMFNDDYYEPQEILKVIEIDLNKHPHEPYFFNTKAMVYREIGDYNSAIKFIEMALSYEEKNIDFMRNKALIFIDLKRFDDANDSIMEARLVHLYDENLKKMEDYIDFQQAINEQKEKLKNIEKGMLKQSDYIKNIRFDFIALAGVFIAFLTIITRMATLNYSNYENYSHSELFLQQLLINSPWLIALLVLFIFLFIISSKKNK